MADGIGRLILRLTLGGLLLFHGVAKITGSIGFIERMMQGHGLPGFFAYTVYVGEVVAPLLVITGWYSRVGAAIIVVQFAIIFFFAHPGQFLTLSRSGGWALELDGFYLLTALALVLLGPGRFSVNRR